MHNERPQPTHLGMEEANGAALRIVRAERIRTDKLGQLRSLMYCSGAERAHFVQHDPHTSARQLPSALAAGKPAPDDVNWAHSFGHFGKLSPRCRATTSRE